MDGWIEPQGRSHAGGGGGTDRKTQTRQTDAPSVDKLGYERPGFLEAINPARGKKISFIFNDAARVNCVHMSR